MPTIGLCMIVKNEAAVIERCLNSVKEHVDHITIVDTGSGDGTPDIIESWLRHHAKEGFVADHPWVDFGFNRSRAMELAGRAGTDYILVIDADDVLDIPEGRLPFSGVLSKDAYELTIRHGDIEFPRLQLFKAGSGWHYRGVLHEFADSDKPNKIVGALDVVMQTSRSGHRSQDPMKYIRDAEVLDRALATETDELLRRRYSFYMAQSYRDAGHTQEAITAYRLRAAMGGYQEEVYYSLLQVGLLMIGQERPEDHPEILSVLGQAIRLVPRRAEAPHALGRYLRLRGEYEAAVVVLAPYRDTDYPKSSLFGVPWIYHYGILDELSVCQYWTGMYARSLQTILVAVKRKGVPEGVLRRMCDNAVWSIRGLHDS